MVRGARRLQRTEPPAPEQGGLSPTAPPGALGSPRIVQSPRHLPQPFAGAFTQPGTAPCAGHGAGSQKGEGGRWLRALPTFTLCPGRWSKGNAGCPQIRRGSSRTALTSHPPGHSTASPAPPSLGVVSRGTRHRLQLI